MKPWKGKFLNNFFCVVCQDETNYLSIIFVDVFNPGNEAN